MADERVPVFIDGSNFYHALKAKFGRAGLDFAKFALEDRLLSNRIHLIAHAWNHPFYTIHMLLRQHRVVVTNASQG